MPGTTALLSPPGALYEQAAQFAADLGAMQQAAADQMLAAHAEAYARIRAEYAAVLDKITLAKANGTPTSPAWAYQQTRLKRALASTKVELAKYAEHASETARKAQWAAVQAAVKHAAKQGQQAMAENGVDGTFLDLNPANLQHLVGFLSDGSPLDHLLQSLGTHAAEQARLALVQGLALGKGTDWMARRVDQALDLPRWRAETIMRTESHRVYRAAAAETFQANADVLEGWVWVAHLDARTCPACLVLDGSLHGLHERMDGHPRCRCAMVPRTRSWADLGADDTLPDTRPPVREGKAWLEKQPAATQRAILGPGKFAAWKSGKITLDDVVARTHDAHWGTTRRERSLREIRKGLHPNYDDQVPVPPPPPVYEPDAALAKAMAGVMGADEIEAVLDQHREAGDWQQAATAKAALAIHLNQQDYAVTLPGPDLPKAAKATDKMNAAVLHKGYPSKGYSQTVAIYKAQANGTVGSKVGVVKSLTWEQKITAQHALDEHHAWLADWAEKQAESKAQAKAIASALADDLDVYGDDAPVTHQEVMGVIEGAKVKAAALPDGPEKDRALAVIQAHADQYQGQVEAVLGYKSQADTWKAKEDAAALDVSSGVLTLKDDGWGWITYEDGSSPQKVHPQVLQAMLNADAWKPDLEPEPDKVALILQALKDPNGYLDTAVLDHLKGQADKGTFDAQHQANVDHAIAQAEALYLPPPKADGVAQIVQLLQEDEGLWLPVTQGAAKGNAQATPQHKSNAQAALAQHEALKAEQAKIKADKDAELAFLMAEPDDGGGPESEPALGTPDGLLVQMYHRDLVVGNYTPAEYAALAKDPTLSPSARAAFAHAVDLHKAGLPLYDEAWGAFSEATVQARLALMINGDTVGPDHFLKDLDTEGLSGKAKAGRWEALFRYYTGQTSAGTESLDEDGKPTGAHPLEDGLVAGAPQAHTSEPDPGPVQEVGGHPFGPAPKPESLSFTGQTLGTHGARVYVDAQGNRYLHKPPANSADQFLVALDEAASVLQARTGLKAPDTWTVTLDGRPGSLQRMFQAEDAFPGGFQPETLSQPDLLAVQQQHVLDWLLSNHDGHLQQFLRTPDGTLVGIDKGQAFRWMGQDRLDWKFHPNAHYGAPPPVYNALWGNFARGDGYEVLDPRSGALADFIASVQAMDDDALKALFRPYAEQAAARGLLAKPQPTFPGIVKGADLPTNDPEAFLDLIVKRKASLADDFAGLYDRAAKERAKNVPGWKPKKAAPGPKAKAAGKAKALKGAPEPVAPTAPVKPEAAIPANHWDDFLAKAEARYQANPNKVKATLKDTANWSRFQRVIEQRDRQAVAELHQRQYLDDDLRDQALALIEQADAIVKAAEAEHADAAAKHERAMVKYRKDLAAWREANGIKITTLGMEHGVVRHDSDSAGTQWAHQHFQESRYTAGQRAALRTYTGSTYTSWNTQLRSSQGDPGAYKASMDKADKAMAVQPIPEDVILHRGTGLDSFVIEGVRTTYSDSERIPELVGTVQRDWAYMSTSVGNSAAFRSHAVQIKFRVPKGTPAAYVDTFSQHGGEREVLLARGTHYYVHAVYKAGGKWIMEAEIVPADFQAPVDPNGKPITQPASKPWTH